MEKIIREIKRLERKNMINNIKISKDNEHIEFKRGLVLFMITSFDNETYDLQVYKLEKRILCDKEIIAYEKTILDMENIIDEEYIITEILDSVNDRELYKDSEQLIFDDYKIILRGDENKVLVKWYREKIYPYVEGVEYSVHTLGLQNELIWGHYFLKLEDAKKYFRQYNISDAERQIMYELTIGKIRYMNFSKYLLEEFNIDYSNSKVLNLQTLIWIKQIYKNYESTLYTY